MVLLLVLSVRKASVPLIGEAVAVLPLAVVVEAGRSLSHAAGASAAERAQG